MKRISLTRDPQMVGLSIRHETRSVKDIIKDFLKLQERRGNYDLEKLSVYFQIYPQAVLARPAQQLCIFRLLKPRDSASTSEKVSSNSPLREYCSTIREGLGFLFLYRSVYIGL